MFVINQMPKSISAEAYRTLRTGIQYSSIDKGIKSLVITSSILGEGKSTVAGNLAYALCQNGSKVLFIDCDLRRPSLHVKFGLSKEQGLTDLLIEKITLKECIKKIEPKLDLITAGTLPPNPAEILGSHAMEKFLKEVSEIYDYVILDTPPVLSVTDGLLLGAKADATLLVVRANKTKGKIIQESYKQLIKVNANIIGTVLNDSEQCVEIPYESYGQKKKYKFIKGII